MKEPDEAITCPNCLFWAKRFHTEEKFKCDNCGWEGINKATPLRILRNL